MTPRLVFVVAGVVVGAAVAAVAVSGQVAADRWARWASAARWLESTLKRCSSD